MPKQKRPRRPSVSIVGSGRLGSALAVALAAAGYPVDALVARRRANATRASKLIDVETLALSANQLAQLPRSKVVIISTPDDAIQLVARRLASLETGKSADRVFLHTSGALSSAILTPLSAKGFAVGSLHPLLSVSEPRKGAESLRGAFWCVEGDGPAVKTARLIVNDLNGQGFSLRAEHKPLYHAAAVMASGHVVALFDLAIDMLMRTGLTRPRAREILLPLIVSNTGNLTTTDPARALTGTFARGDIATVQRHLRALSPSDLSDALAVYRLLGLRSLRLAEKNTTDRRALRQIKKLLETENVDELSQKRGRRSNAKMK